MMSKFKLPKWAVVIAAALLFLSLAVDWVAPGEGTRLAAGWLLGLGEVGARGAPRTMFPLWGWLVGLAGKDVAALGAISAGAGLVCVWLVAMIFGAIFGAAVRGAKADGVKGEEGRYDWVESAAVLLAGLAFALTPGFLAAATRVSPLMVALLPPLAAVALVVRSSKGRLLLAGGLVGYSAFELILAWRIVWAMAFPALWVYLAVGVMPALVIAWCVRKRWLVSRKAFAFAFGGWTLAVVVMGATSFTLGVLNRGRVANRIVAQIVANLGEAGREDGKVAIVSDGALDELFFFMLPEDVKLISLARERDPAYGRELSEWVSGLVVVGSRSRTEEVKNSTVGLGLQTTTINHSTTTTTNYNSDLAFAAELGPRALIDEWMKLDKAGFEAAVATVATYFPTRAKWEEACDELDGMRADEPLAKYLRHLLAVCGNALGCRMLEEISRSRESKSNSGGLGSASKLKAQDKKLHCSTSTSTTPTTTTTTTTTLQSDAWAIFKKIVDSVEPTNYAAYLNLLGMVQRGYAASKDDVSDLTKRRQKIEKDLKTWERIVRAARSGGRLYADPESVAKYEQAKREEAARRELTPEERRFAETVVAAPKDPKSGKAAQEAIHKAIREGKVRSDAIGGHLISIDLALGDMESAEKDAIEILKLDHHHPTANATLGALAGMRGDYERAERYLRRAIATGKASIAAKNDLACVLMELGRLDEAEPLAREAVKAFGEAWTLHETLAAILIRKGRVEEGERELQKAEELAEKAGIQKGKIVSIEIDRALLMRAKGEWKRFRMRVRSLRQRKDLTDAQKKELKELEAGD